MLISYLIICERDFVHVTVAGIQADINYNKVMIKPVSGLFFLYFCAIDQLDWTIDV